MSDNKKHLSNEKNIYGKVYVDITYAIDNISPFLSKEDLNKRKFVKKVNVIKRYIDLLEASEKEASKGGFFKFFKDDNSIQLVNSYKLDNKDDFVQLEHCSKCSCLNCTSNCSFNSCSGCRFDSRIQLCDHKKINVTIHTNFTLDLTNDRTGLPDKYKALATLEDCQLDKKYIIIESISSREKFVLYYYPGIVEDTYGEISDAEEFDFVIETFENAEP